MHLLRTDRRSYCLSSIGPKLWNDYKKHINNNGNNSRSFKNKYRYCLINKNKMN